jgi:hypothetical protein
VVPTLTHEEEPRVSRHDPVSCLLGSRQRHRADATLLRPTPLGAKYTARVRRDTPHVMSDDTVRDDLRQFVLARLVEDEQRLADDDLPLLDEAERTPRTSRCCGSWRSPTKPTTAGKSGGREQDAAVSAVRYPLRERINRSRLLVLQLVRA